VTLGAYEHQDVPFEKLVEELSPERDLGGSPLFQVKILLENASAQNLNLPNLQVRSFQSEHSIAKLDLTLFLIDAASSIRGQMEYSSDVFDQDTIEDLIYNYIDLLRQLSADPSRPVFGIAFTTAAAEESFVGEFCQQSSFDM
jgi:non-ribosomal peptide synthetase component F